MLRTFTILTVVCLAAPVSALRAGEGQGCAGKDGAKCCEAARLTTLTSEKAAALAKQIRAEKCPVKSSEILASALPALKCKETLAKLTSDIKGKTSEKEAAQAILTAFKELAPRAELACCALSPEKAEALAKLIRAESCPVKSSEILASALPGLKCQGTLAKLLSDVKAKTSEKEAAQVVLTAMKEFAPRPEAPAFALSAEKAQALVKLIRAESCPDKSSEILASALPGLKCKETLAKLTSEIKETGCEIEAAQVVLTAAKKFAPVSAIRTESCPLKSSMMLASALGLKCKETLARLVSDIKGKGCEKLCASKALSVAAAIRAESCPVKSSEILASALPALKCQETLARLVSDIKSKSCEKEAAEVVLAAQEKLAKPAQAEKKN